MNAYLWASLGAITGLLLSLRYLRRRQDITDAAGQRGDAPAGRGPRPAASAVAKASSPGGFQGVTVKPCLDACDAVQAIVGKRYLSREAPGLPLVGCDQQRCDCTYSHFSDRRERGDRRSGWDTFGGFSKKLVQGNRRDEDSDRRNGG
ncbi:MAG: hypothetical protein OEV14_03940 [Gammaproteobacteria bacterium]|nr:hypothetical protein [Gammaproteobacteria bacterium]